jgi:hypothetical protein
MSLQLNYCSFICCLCVDDQQVGQILQVLTVSSAEDVDPKSRDLYSKFPKVCISVFLMLISCKCNGNTLKKTCME